MASFAEFFHLTAPQRVSFELSPKHDAELLIDLDELVPKLREVLRNEPAAPRAVIHGEFGTGKTHYIRYLEKVLARPAGFLPVYLELGGFGSRSTFFDLHIRVMNALDGLVSSLPPQLKDLNEWLAHQDGLNDDVRHAFRQMAHEGLRPEQKALIRSWLVGTGPTPSQARKAGFTGRLFERSGPVELVALWKAIGSMHREVTGASLLLLIDEGESFGRIVEPDAQASIGSGLRSLLDADNKELGCIFALNLPQAREGMHPFLRTDVTSRLAGKIFTLGSLGEPYRVRSFLEGLWRALSDGSVDLFQRDALELVTGSLPRLRAAISPQYRAASTTPTQRDLVQVLSYLGSRAFHEGHPPPLKRSSLRNWFSLGEG